jgi:hypothetical protein
MEDSPAGDGFDLLIKTMSDYKTKTVIADAAISWREALLGGRFNKANSRLTTLLILIDDYLRETPTPDENPHTVGDTVPGLD